MEDKTEHKTWEETVLTEEWQANFTDKIATKYEKRVGEIEAECQARVERIFKKIGTLVKWTEKHYDSNTNVGTPDSTGGVINLGNEYLLINKEKLQALKKDEGVK